MIPTDPPSTKTIVCIDDDASILRYERALLERSGYEVLTAPSGQQGLKLATSCQCDAVLLDYEMYGINGQEVASEIKRVKPELVVILVSGREIPMQALAVVDAFVPKLEASQQLLPIIAQLCVRRQKAKHGQESI
jgi:DNA-binding NtrC family response regulator